MRQSPGTAQEPRTTIRVTHHCETRYASSDNLPPKNGYMTDLSERGARLWVRERHPPGERVTVDFPLLGEQDALTATGIVRWSDAQLHRWYWYQEGLEWLPLEGTAHQRLHRSLSRSSGAPAPAVDVARARLDLGAPPVRRLPLRIGLIGGLLVWILWILWSLWASSLSRRHAMLQATLQERSATIQRLERESTRLREELGRARTRLELTSEEVAGLTQQAHLLEGKAQQLNQDVARFQQSYTQLQQERNALVGQVRDLTRERAALLRRVVSEDRLRLAVREAIARRKAARPARAIPLREISQ
ncbi:MAG: PilZ domain-containing protein [Candidatus Omnitrophica bacterium]|nr:PilZ domain-containing protein [Candidatus Omnitrophota bacterium]